MKEEFSIEIGVPFYPSPSCPNKVFLDSILMTAFIFGLIEIMFAFVWLISFFDPLFNEIFNSIFLIISISLIGLFFISIFVGCIITKLLLPLYMKNISYTIFNDEIVIKCEIAPKKTQIIPLKSISNVELRRGFFDRMLNIGNIVISNKCGTGGQITGISNYDEVNNFLQERFFLLKRQKS